MDIRAASLQTLGYICDEIGANDINDETKSNIVVALTQNISGDDDKQKICNLAIKAFFSALPFASKNFQKAEERDFIMKALFEAFKSSDEDI